MFIRRNQSDGISELAQAIVEVLARVDPADRVGGGDLPPSFNALVYGHLDGLSGSASCCAYGAMGCACRCSRRNPARGCFGGYALADTDWPGIDWKSGLGPGPFLQYSDVFPLEGREDLVPFRW